MKSDSTVQASTSRDLNAIISSVLGVDQNSINPDLSLSEQFGATEADIREILRRLNLTPQEGSKSLTPKEISQQMLWHSGQPTK
ncbi:MAG: hypothetical protein PHS62_00730 [Patescibacteria group bacterium]|nr:hypothetical protein [Patescibacteria group bacterium]